MIVKARTGAGVAGIGVGMNVQNSTKAHSIFLILKDKICDVVLDAAVEDAQ